MENSNFDKKGEEIAKLHEFCGLKTQNLAYVSKRLNPPTPAAGVRHHI